ncbi:S41 family peptidase [Vallitalea okinawensis]|uniref:S41 family peptidase n=1 Tax=Vallitalea okinawensis TaxID=2078660 RepID=UPI0013005475|nr:S41 family peptidase [Vallitalea okinawensis]
MKKVILVLIILVGLTGCTGNQISDHKKVNGDNIQVPEVSDFPAIENQTLENLYAFSKIYGYVRFFHPSKEGHNLDWDKFAVYGVSQIKYAEDDIELKEQLEEIFLPIAPKIKISFDPDLNYQCSLNDDDDDLYAWQHEGVEVNGRRSQTAFKSWKNNSRSKLFDTFPEDNEMIKESISSDLYVYIPLALYKLDAIPDGDYTNGYRQLLSRLDEMDVESFTADEQDVRLADIIITWNVIQHFFPYFDVLDIKWEEQLIPYLERALVDQTPEEFEEVLNELLVNLEDGHAIAYNENMKIRKALPVRFDLIEDRVVVSRSETPLLKTGDIILSIDGMDTLDYLYEKEKLISGSSQYKQYRALRYLAIGNEGDKVSLQVKSHDSIKDIELAYNQSSVVDVYDRPYNFEEIEEGIFYINLDTKFNTARINEHMDDLKSAKGVIFDNRGYPSNDIASKLVPYLIDETVESPAYSAMQIVYPNREKYDLKDYVYEYSPLEDKIDGKFFFLIDASAISQAENIPYIAFYNQLGELIGQATAGANGNRNGFSLPGGYKVFFTGLRVENPDGSQFHARGIKPDYYVKRTINGVTEGRDEFIEKAIEIITNP